MGRSTQPAKKTVDGETNEREVVRVASNQLKLKLDNLRTFQPLTNNQKKFFDAYKQGDYFIALHGVAGTGKTLLATEHAIKQFLLGYCDKIIFTRPSVSVDEDLGYLPGTLEEKMAPWVRPIYDVLHNFIHPNEVKELMEEKLI